MRRFTFMAAWLQGLGLYENPTGVALHCLMSRLAALLLVLAAAPASAANFATCVLDKMPGTQNDVAAVAIYQVCRAKHGSIETVAQGSGRGIFSPDSGAECTAKKAGDTRSNRAAFLIGAACRKLYDEPNPFNQYDR